MQYSLAMVSQWGLVVILIVILLVFGAGKLPEIGKNLGLGIKNLKKGLKEGMQEDEPPQQPQRQIPSSNPSVGSLSAGTGVPVAPPVEKKEESEKPQGGGA